VTAFRPTLPPGWFYPDEDQARNLLEELRRELPPGHPLFGVALETLAWQNGANDDTLFRHRDTPDRVTVVHLTWKMKPESPGFPAIEFDGGFEQFLAAEERKVRWLREQGDHQPSDQ
jgi:hypothetical protein